VKTNFSSPNINKQKFFKRILSLPFPLRVLGFLASITLIASSFFIGTAILDKYFFVSVPKHGGSLNEGVIGRPRLINPVVAKTEVDRDLVSLIYSGLFRPTGDTLEPDLAEKVEISEDGKIYTVTLKSDATFHDGKPLTASDVIFTVERIQNKGLPIKSPLAPNFNGVNVSLH
jgi:ABC-type transport system substrate-binding protein